MKKLSSKVIFSLFLLFYFLKGVDVLSYTVYPSCPDFTDITASHVVANYGTTSNPLTSPYVNTGIIDGRHTIITEPGTDPNTGNVLQMILPGETQVVKLGNSNVGYEAEALTYHFIVDKELSILQVKFAVVFEDPGHPYEDQPRFRVRVMDKNGDLVGDCSEYDVTAFAGLDGFNSYGRVRWRDWTTLTLDLSHMAGEEIQVQYTSYDCNYGGHFGYAYFTASCMKNQLSLQNCTGSEVTAAAPEGYNSYLWDNGDTTLTSTRTLTGSEMTISCLITTEMGCYFTVYGTVTENVPIIPPGGIITDTICEDYAYLENGFTVMPHQDSGDYTYYNTYMNPLTCEDDITVRLKLHVLSGSYDLFDKICFGESYTDNGFDIQNPSIGLHKETLVVSRASEFCDSTIFLNLTVTEQTSTPFPEITGRVKACTGERLLYTLSPKDTTATYNWTMPSHARLISGQGTYAASVLFDSVTVGQISVVAENGCKTQVRTIDVTTEPVYHNFIPDTICIGTTYSLNGFFLPKQDSVGNFIFTNSLQTQAGCDSITVLRITVMPEPEVEITVIEKSIICAGSEVTLAAESPHIMNPILDAPKVVVGDILCTDSTTVRPADFIASGKVARGVVFHVDSTGEHGFAAALSDVDTLYQWSTELVDVPGLEDVFWGWLVPFPAELDGYNNTLILQSVGTPATYPGAYAVDIANGWYLPTIVQLSSLRRNEYMLAEAYTVTGGDILIAGEYYMSSSEYDDNNNYALYDLYFDNLESKDSYQYIREVCSF